MNTDLKVTDGSPPTTTCTAVSIINAYPHFCDSFSSCGTKKVTFPFSNPNTKDLIHSVIFPNGGITANEHRPFQIAA